MGKKRMAGLLVWTVVVFWHLAALAAEAPVSAVMLTWTGDASTTQTIAWQTPPGSGNTGLMYIRADAPEAEISLAQTLQADTASFRTEDGETLVHTVNLTGLVPGARYMYRIGDGQNWIKDGSFATALPGAAFKFLVFGDSQSYDYKVWQTTFESAYKKNRDARFFVNVGDLVDNGQTHSQWRAWFGAIGAHAASLPVVPVVGNHETYTPERNFSLPYYFTRQFSLPANGPAGMKEQAYSFDYGDVHIVVLDTQIGEERKFLPDSLERQKSWLTADLAATRKPWKLVFMHRPPYHNRVKESGQDAATAFIPIFDAYGVDAVFSGHDHVNARTPRMKAGKADSAGTLYTTVGRSGTKYYDTVGAKSWNAQFYNPTDQPTYVVVQIHGKILYAQVFKQNGELLDAWSLMKLQHNKNLQQDKLQ